MQLIEHPLLAFSALFLTLIENPILSHLIGYP
jgi:hypothetical protein